MCSCCTIDYTVISVCWCQIVCKYFYRYFNWAGQGFALQNYNTLRSMGLFDEQFSSRKLSVQVFTINAKYKF